MERPVGLGLSAIAVLALGVAGIQMNQGHRQAEPVVIPRPSSHNATSAKRQKTGNPAGTCIAYRDIPAVSKAGDDEGVATDVIADFLRQPGRTPESRDTAGLHYAIALVPDPHHTHLSMVFDRLIDSIEAAAQDEGFTYNSSWLPWPVDKHDYLILADQDEEDLHSKQLEECPGVLLFRNLMKPGNASRVSAADAYASGLIVFLVGEQPTGGINQQQWVAARDWIARLGKKTGYLHILGPNHSGTLTSLENALEPRQGPDDFFRAENLKVDLFSGTVSNCRSLRRFQQYFEQSTKSVVLAAFKENDALVIHRFLQYLESQHVKPEDVAIVQEDETAYGSSEVASNNESDPCDPPYPEGKRPVKLFYPRDISELRTAYQEQSIFSVRGPSGESAGPVRTILNGDLGDADTESGDTVATYSKQQTPMSEETVLYGLVSYLRAHHSKYILLRSSNPLDFVFLTRFFHHTYPEGRVVIVSADLLLRREVDTTEFRGTMTLTNYPLFPGFQHWSELKGSKASGKHAHRVFLSEAAEGSYIAMRYLLRLEATPCLEQRVKPAQKDQQPTIEQDPPVPLDNAEPSWQGKAGSTPAPVGTWLTALGRDGYWPVAYLSKATVDSLKQKPLGQDGPPPSTSVKLSHDSALSLEREIHENAPSSWIACFAACLLILVWHIRRLAGVNTSIALRSFRYGDKSELWIQAVFCGSSTLCLFALFATLLVPLALDITRTYLVTYKWLTGSMVFFPIVVYLAFALLPRRAGDVQFELNRITLACVPALSLLFLFMFLPRTERWLANCIDSTRAFLYTYRAIHLNNGISPLPTLLFLFGGLYVWCWQSMLGRALLGSGRPMLPQIGTGTNQMPVKFRQISSEVAERIEAYAKPLSGSYLWVAIVPASIFCAVCFSVTGAAFPVESFEGAFYKWLVGALFMLCLCLIVTGGARLLFTWRALKTLLRELARLPLQRSFCALEDVSTRSLWEMSSNVPKTQYKFLVRELSTIRGLQAATTGDLGPFQSSAPLANMQQLERVLDYGQAFTTRYSSVFGSTGEWEMQLPGSVFTQPAFVRAELADCAGYLLALFLDPAWQQEEKARFNAKTTKQTDDGQRLKFVKETTSPAQPLSQDALVRGAEEFVCLVYITYIKNMLARMRSQVYATSCILVAMLLSVAFYPFVPRPGISMWMVLLLLMVSVVVYRVYAAMERDQILSAVTNSPAGLTWEFALKYAAFLVPPLLALLTAQFPAVADQVSAWLQPGLEALH